MVKYENCRNLNDFFAKIDDETNRQFPETISKLRPFPIDEMRKFTDRLNNTTDEFYDRLNNDMKGYMDELKKLNREELNDEEKISFDIFMLRCKLNNDGYELYKRNMYVITQRGGVYNVIPYIMTKFHDIQVEIDAVNYISRLKDVGRRFDESIKSIQDNAEAGTVLPRFLFEKTINAITDFTAVDIKENVLMKDFTEKLRNAGIDSPILKQEAEKTIRDCVYPSYIKLADKMKELHAISDDNAGIWKLRNGVEYYKFRLKVFIGQDTEPAEIFEMGMNEVERIEQEAKNLFKQTEYAHSNLRESYAAMNSDKRFLYPDTDKGREQCMNDFENMLEEIERGTDKVFDLKPAMKCIIKRVPEFLEKNYSAGSYSRPSLDGVSPPSFNVNLYNMGEIKKYMMRTLLYHESVPGHHFNIGIEMGLDIPSFRKDSSIPAFSEGWALYAEKLAYEMGFHQDVHSNLGRLNDELMRAVRCVVDTGIHYKRWTRQQAIVYMYEHTGQTMPTIQKEIDRYIVWPAQAVTYKIGEQKILKLREKAKTALRDKFNIKIFHNHILQHGTVPLSILEQSIDKWIQSENHV